ncbi:MAG TPA: TonB family protein [Candidatus Elarobacter sp.]|nr:TonB family protein [Candidatus Elarobacter sp.]
MSAAFAHAALAIAAVLFNSLWEGALIAGAVWLGLRCLPKLGAATRYAIWLCALAALVLTPLLTVSLSAQPSATVTDAAVTNQQSDFFIAPGPRQQPRPQPRSYAPQALPEPASAASEPIPAAPRKAQILIPQSVAVAAALIWVLVACARALLLLLNVRALAAIRRDASLWSAAHDYPIFLSDRVQAPCATGFLRAAIVLPASLVEYLRPDAVETIVVHEVAHLRRYDVWTNAFARVAEALLVLNPAAWFVMRRLSTEREIACDDWVVARTGAGDAFARTLAALVNSGGARAPIAAPSALGSRHSVVVRIERLLDSRPRRLRLSPSALGGALMLLALIAFTVQSVSPVLAYEQPQQSMLARGSAAAGCAVPNRGAQAIFFRGIKTRTGSPPYGADLPDPDKLVAKFGAANVATFDLTVDATGHPRKVVVLSAPRYPGMVKHVTHILMANTFLPALHDCAPVATTTRTALRFGTPVANVSSIVVPAYPKGWSTRHASACKVPTLLHTGVPAYPDAMKNMSVDARYTASVRVHLDATGAVTNAAVVAPSGQPAFDDALLDAARQATYPLKDETGFKPVRPSGAKLTWNAAHGSDTFVNCKPLPTDYVWNTTFSRIVPIGILGFSALVLWQ